MSKNPCAKCDGICADDAKDGCELWLAYDRDRLARRVAKLEGLIVRVSNEVNGKGQDGVVHSVVVGKLFDEAARISRRTGGPR